MKISIIVYQLMNTLYLGYGKCHLLKQQLGTYLLIAQLFWGASSAKPPYCLIMFFLIEVWTIIIIKGNNCSWFMSFFIDWVPTILHFIHFNHVYSTYTLESRYSTLEYMSNIQFRCMLQWARGSVTRYCNIIVIKLW